jgi:hypothetical protein
VKAYLLTIIASLLVFVLLAQAQEVSVNENAVNDEESVARQPAASSDGESLRDPAGEDDSLITRVIQEKNYPGARDEEDLEVQSQLSKPTRKMGGNKENFETAVFDDEF